MQQGNEPISILEQIAMSPEGRIIISVGVVAWLAQFLNGLVKQYWPKRTFKVEHVEVDGESVDPEAFEALVVSFSAELMKNRNLQAELDNVLRQLEQERKGDS